MTVSQAKKIFWGGTVLSTVIFLALTYNSLKQLPQRTHEDALDPHVAQGKWVWQRYNCNDCHTILGIGGYYAPDLTKVMGTRDAAWTRRFLNDPEKVWPAERKMPNLHLRDEEIDDLVAFLSWVNGIDTNDWPPKPLLASTAALSKQAQQGAALFRSLGCSACHTIRGVGGKVGPDLTDVGSRRTKGWIEQQVRNPKSHFPNSIMPSFTKLSANDMRDLGDYLTGLK
jgi:nitric oxide reductase subunit C